MTNPDADRTISVRDFEQRVQALEGVTLVLYAPSNTLVSTYPYERKVPDAQSMTDFLNARVRPYIGEIECAIISASNMGRVHPRTTMEFLRNAEAHAIDAQPSTTRRQQFGERTTKRSLPTHPDSFPSNFQER